MTVTRGEQDIIFFRIPLCSKCKAVAGHLRAIREEHPEITVSELNFITNLGLARRHGLMTVPALLVRGRPLTGPVSKGEILEALGLDRA
jgi:hypothetical protein